MTHIIPYRNLQRVSTVILTLMLSLGNPFWINPLLAQARVQGLDVSKWQWGGNPDDPNNRIAPDWAVIHNQGYDFIYAESSDGLGESPVFNENMQGARGQGMLVGAFHFARPTQSDAVTQAQHFIDVAGAYLGYKFLPPALDVEDGDTLGAAALSNWVEQWMEYVNQNTPGHRLPIIYANRNYASLLGSLNNGSSNPYGKWALWIADPRSPCDSQGNPNLTSPNGTHPPLTWTNWRFWQYCKAQVSGIPGNGGFVDMDLFNGSLQTVGSTLGLKTLANPPDLNGDGHVNSADLSIVLSWWLSTSYPPADMDQSGKVFSTDLNTMIQHWYNPYDATTDVIQENPSSNLSQNKGAFSSSPSLSISPNTGSFQVGESFDVDIFVNTDGQDTVTVATYVKYDPVYFSANSVDTSDSIFPTGAEETIDPTFGLVRISRGETTPGVNTSNGKVGRINFTALAPISPTTDNMTFGFIPGATNRSGVYQDDGTGINYLASIYNARFSVCTAPPGIPTLSGPSDGATNVSSSPVLGWGAMTDASSYDVQVCSDSGCSSVVASATSLTISQWTVSPVLNKNTTYWWRVEANNGCGSSAWSSTWSFTTGNCFIATAAFGTAEQGKIDVLRSFRDAYLTKPGMGKAFVEAYYAHSPAVADYIAHRVWLRAVIRTLLLPVIGFISVFV